jgi:DNA-binding transcriptional MerR regulator
MALDILEDDPLLREEEAAQELGRTVRTLRRWRRDLRLGPPTISLGRQRYYRRSALRQWLLSREGRQ